MSEYTLVLIRHGESQWNKDNRFTGWYDVPLAESGIHEAHEAATLLKDAQYQFDVAYTSILKRAIKTLWIILEDTDQMYIPVIRDWRLNERMYGALQGLNKIETVQKHGAEKVLEWRRSYAIPPPAMDANHEFHPRKFRVFDQIPDDQLPLTECLKDTVDRVLPYWNDEIAPMIKTGKRVVIAAHGNSLRALVKYLDNIPEDAITGLDIPTGLPLVYKLDQDLKPFKQANSAPMLSGFYLGDPEVAKAKAAAVANQTAVKK